MTKEEKAALKVHNSFFVVPAKELKVLHGDKYPELPTIRFMVVYDDGTIKYDYECGSVTKDISKVLV